MSRTEFGSIAYGMDVHDMRLGGRTLVEASSLFDLPQVTARKIGDFFSDCFLYHIIYVTSVEYMFSYICRYETLHVS